MKNQECSFRAFASRGSILRTYNNDMYYKYTRQNLEQAFIILSSLNVFISFMLVCFLSTFRFHTRTCSYYQGQGLGYTLAARDNASDLVIWDADDYNGRANQSWIFVEKTSLLHQKIKQMSIK